MNCMADRSFEYLASCGRFACLLNTSGKIEKQENEQIPQLSPTSSPRLPVSVKQVRTVHPSRYHAYGLIREAIHENSLTVAIRKELTELKLSKEIVICFKGGFKHYLCLVESKNLGTTHQNCV